MAAPARVWRCELTEMKAARALSLGVLAACLAGCAVGPNYHVPETVTPREFIGSAEAGGPAAPAARPAVDLTQWWQALNDPELDSLIDRAIRANPDIEIALTRLQEVRSQQGVLVGDALPAVAASAAAGRGTGSDITRAGAAPAPCAGRRARHRRRAGCAAHPARPAGYPHPG